MGQMENASVSNVSLETEMDDSHAIGDILRTAREESGESIEDVSQMLRINWRYIQALEDGDFDRLPGTAYAIGFIRTYSDYLNIDSVNLVSKYKNLDTISQAKTNLEFPEPIHESSLPGGAILSAGLIVAVLAYGGWYLASEEDDAFTQVDPPVSEQHDDKTDKQFNEVSSGSDENASGARDVDQSQVISEEKPKSANGLVELIEQNNERSLLGNVIINESDQETNNNLLEGALEGEPEEERIVEEEPIASTYANTTIDAEVDAAATEESIDQVQPIENDTVQEVDSQETVAIPSDESGTTDSEIESIEGVVEVVNGDTQEVVELVNGDTQETDENLTDENTESTLEIDNPSGDEVVNTSHGGDERQALETADAPQEVTEQLEGGEVLASLDRITEETVADVNLSDQNLDDEQLIVIDNTPPDAGGEIEETIKQDGNGISTTSIIQESAVEIGEEEVKGLEIKEETQQSTELGSNESDDAQLARKSDGDADEEIETGRVFGNTNAARIIVRAKTSSWIQVRVNSSGELLITRLLRAGDEYHVPNRDGLSLLTGNAGALQVLVDGGIVPSIGGAGDVRRNVALDAELLKAGNAIGD